MRLVIDIGNSDTVLGLFENNILKEVGRWNSKQNDNYELIKGQISLVEWIKNDFDQIVLSSVVPELNILYIDFFKEEFGVEPVLVNTVNQKMLEILIDEPAQLGTDLFINALIANELYKERPKLVIDFGTALTFTSVSAKSQILGVNIVPGINTALKALFSDAALLPKVKLEKPKNIIGKNTIEAIQSGIVYGYEGLITNIINKIASEIGEMPILIATGGLSIYSEIFDLKFDRVDKNLTINGLNLYGNIIGNVS